MQEKSEYDNMGYMQPRVVD